MPNRSLLRQHSKFEKLPIKKIFIAWVIMIYTCLVPQDGGVNLVFLWIMLWFIWKVCLKKNSSNMFARWLGCPALVGLLLVPGSSCILLPKFFWVSFLVLCAFVWSIGGDWRLMEICPYALKVILDNPNRQKNLTIEEIPDLVYHTDCRQTSFSTTVATAAGLTYFR